MAVNQALAMALIIAMSGPLAGGLLWRLIDPFGRAASPEVAHACLPSDPYAGSSGGHTWADIGFISAAALPAGTIIVEHEVRVMYVSYSM